VAPTAGTVIDTGAGIVDGDPLRTPPAAVDSAGTQPLWLQALDEVLADLGGRGGDDPAF
jgi:hypothetical protein